MRCWRAISTPLCVLRANLPSRVLRHRFFSAPSGGYSADELEAALAFVQRHADLPGATRRLSELHARMDDPALWANPAQAAQLSREHGRLAAHVDRVRSFIAEAREEQELLELAKEIGDGAAELSSLGRLGALQARAQRMRYEVLLGGGSRAQTAPKSESADDGEADDADDCYVEIHAGAGGEESCDWCAMLLRMYRRWFAGKGMEVSDVSLSPSGDGGFRSITVLVSGMHAHGWALGERGVHRLVRISPFDAQHRRHTSFARVSVLPVPAPSSPGLAFDERDLRVDTYRSSGAGGQHVNTTDSAVRIVHLPTGITVTCSSERSQHSNRQTAMSLLAAKLRARQEEQRLAERDRLTADLGENTWGNQIRSYIMQPYQLVKDHRTGLESSDVLGVLDGDLDRFAEAALEWRVGVWAGPASSQAA